MKKLNKFIFKLGLTLILLLFINSMDFTLTINKERNSLFNSFVSAISGTYSIVKQVKHLI